ncbi:TraR/DksA family transcriptional regulator [Thalassotalea agarivorans]|uniref:Transcriptional regulator, TraR/DksA family n=1 Tax=Thalassotalea agarivorans TaxID=349064 RepID=A0A1I0CRX7_THASX|nr:TraR/DksA C4-type zinc finger protein [Thalassotalea agarivorans]SET22077.1 transcriptional regulator, TraR/DksA family [Thalassotalea agarivorans]
MPSSLKESFTQRIVELQKRIDSIHADFAQGRNADWAEQARERENDEVLNALESEAKVEIQQLSDAILRIDAGTYGVCGSCGEDIAKQRLEVQPSATQCIKCAS